MCCYSVQVRRKGAQVSSKNLHPDYLLVKRWADATGLTLDDLHDDLGSKPFAHACGIGDYPVGVVEQVRVDVSVHRAPLVVIAESRGYDMARFVREHWAWLKQLYVVTQSDAPVEQEGWVETTGEVLSEMRAAE